jgi:hypothetical protein
MDAGLRHAQGIEAEILLRSKRLERIARFFAVPPQKMRPKVTFKAGLDLKSRNLPGLALTNLNLWDYLKKIHIFLK